MHIMEEYEKDVKKITDEVERENLLDALSVIKQNATYNIFQKKSRP